MRAKGHKVGVLSPNVLRPFPADEFREQLRGVIGAEVDRCATDNEFAQQPMQPARSTGSRHHQLAAVLDQQLQDTIYQFEHKRGVVQRIDESSRQLAEALENAVPVIITTLQKFPFVSRQLLKMAEERGESGTGTLATRRCAVVVARIHQY